MGRGRVPGGGVGEGSERPSMAGHGGGGRQSGGTTHVWDGIGESACGSVRRKENGSGPTKTMEFFDLFKRISKGSDLIWLKDGFPKF
jgi:hypothetical protein